MSNSIDTSKMSGIDLFEYYTSQDGEYKETLQMAEIQLGEDLFPLLERCEREGKKIILKFDNSLQDACDQPYTVELI